MAEQKDPRQIYQITTPPGFSRDGTILDRKSFIDGQWVRFQRGRPRKMGGYREVSMNIGNIPRGAYVSVNNLVYMYGFGAAHAYVAPTVQSVSTTVASDTTFPDLTDDDLYTFQADAIFDANGSGTSIIMVHPAQNLADISDQTNTNIYYTDLNVNPPTWSKMGDGAGGFITVSGGVVVLQPYVFVYGNNGLIKNSNANAPNDFVIGPNNDANEVNVSSQKVVKGLPLRGGVNSPAGLFWALDSLIRVSYVGGDKIFKYDPVSGQISVLSANSIVEYDGVYYWIGIDRFLLYNGTVQEIPNEQNFNWFFDNLNYTQRSKVWAIKNHKFGEIWWFFPFGDATECTNAIVYNVRGNFWFDVELGRSAGFESRVFRYPTMWSNTLNSNDQYSAFVHEYGRNAILNNQEIAIPSYFETSDFGWPTGGADSEKPVGNDYWTRLIRVEPDFVQDGPMSVEVLGEEFAQTATKESDPYPFSPDTGKVDMREQRRQIRLRFESNIIDGHYEMGRVLLHTEFGDIRS